ncbi:MAG: YlmC/YmxH family sporulation protein [Clostridia bacterium]|nr:YlmC/YmxH family sporulation protein [Clostridia bacterium]
MIQRIAELKDRQVVCVQDGTILGYVGDVELDTTDGRLSALIIFGRPKALGILGREDDIIIPWENIDIIGDETILVKCG